jgi:hypothetical protein
MWSLYHRRLNRARRSRWAWERVHPQKARKTIHTTYDVEDAAEGHTMSGIRSVQPVVMARQPNFANTLGPIRRSTAFASVAELDMDR